jgi:hypothetical protein
MLSYLFVPEIAANIMSFATESFADYRYRRRLIKDEFLRACYDKACPAMKIPEQAPKRAVGRYYINVKMDANHFNEVVYMDKNICSLHTRINALQFVKVVPDHINTIYINEDVEDYDELMASLRHILVSPYYYRLDLCDRSEIQLIMKRATCKDLRIQWKQPLPLILSQDIIDNLAEVFYSRQYHGPVVDLSECEKITELIIGGDMTLISGLKLERLTMVDIIYEQFDPCILHRLHSVEHLNIAYYSLKGGHEIDLSAMPSENLEILEISDITVTGLGSIPKLDSLYLIDANITSHLSICPSLKMLGVTRSSSLVVGDGPGPMSIDGVGTLSVSDDIYQHVRETQNMKILRICANTGKQVVLQPHATLRELHMIGIDARNIKPALQPSLRALGLPADGIVAAAAIFGTAALEHVDGQFIHALT